VRRHPKRRVTLKAQKENIGGNKEITILELAKLIKNLYLKKKALPKKNYAESSSKLEFHPFPEDDPQRRKPDISKAKTLLDRKPKVELEEGLKRMIGWFAMSKQSK